MKQILSSLFTFIFFSSVVYAQNEWQVETYPDEIGFTKRNAGMLHKISAREFGERSKAFSKCPDTQLPVRKWAVEGETIISPYTGRSYTQGPTGYFGPKKRNSSGEIIAFGGDPLKYDLPPATATLLLNPEDPIARAFLSIPGNLNQQYHFASMNWARFYPLMSDKMGEKWIQSFTNAVANYEESRRPSDGDREHAYLSHPHDLVGEPGELLGGNVLDGGTENHKAMWRTSALLYAQIFPKGEKISGYTLDEAEKLTQKMIRDYFKGCLNTGNGEYDSQIYYPYSIGGFLNLYDFTPDAETRLLAKSLLDFYLATYGLKVIDGVIAGAQKRGYLSKPDDNLMETYLWMWTGKNEKYNDRTNVTTTIQQTTTNYRPNQIIYNIITKNIPLPFEAKMGRPTYHMKTVNAFQESFYCGHTYGIGNIAMTMVDNPTQQVVWSMVARGKDGPLCFGGGQSRYLSPAGHSPYTQTLQSKGTVLLLTGQTADNINVTSTEKKHRKQHASEKLNYVAVPENNSVKSLVEFMNDSKNMLGSWLFIPNNVDTMIWENNNFYMKANDTYVYVHAIGKKLSVLHPDIVKTKTIPRLLNIFEQYQVIIVQDELSGFIFDTGERNVHGSFEAFISAVNENSLVDKSMLQKKKMIQYKSIYGEQLMMTYQNDGLRAKGSINNKEIDYDNWNDGAVYDSPYVTIKDGIMKLSDGKNGYSVNFFGEKLEYK